MSTTYLNSQSNTGICNMIIAAGGAQVTWNLTSLEVSMAGPTVGPNAKLTVYDGAIGGTVLYSCYLNGPVVAGLPSGGSVGGVQKINLPTNSQGLPCLQSLPGNAMSIQVVGTGQNQVSINARVQDGLG